MSIDIEREPLQKARFAIETAVIFLLKARDNMKIMDQEEIEAIQDLIDESLIEFISYKFLLFALNENN